MVGKQSLWLANHPRCRQPCHFPCSRFQTLAIRHNARDNESCHKMERIFSIKIKNESSSDSTAKVIPISSSECNSSFQELTGRQSSRSNQILTVTDKASLRGRSDKICITSGSIYLALDSHSFWGDFKINNTRFGGLQIFLHKIVRI